MRRKNLCVVAIVVLVLCCTVYYKKVDLDAKNMEYQKRIEELEKQKKKQEQRADEIDDYKVYVQTKKYIEEEARTKLGLVYPDEIIFEAED
ncbi:hypothetical protein FYJ58_08575 [Lachnospiraceae bacterium WCA-693-APC-MOT-I]|uniref:Septum formation initiator n=2 Tax=Velocimicrobium porci TaxID=2606634 RepID=A0A6L5XYH7_9FIRM|nr:hypothetical protein [Velocimicrobium porci]